MRTKPSDLRSPRHRRPIAHRAARARPPAQADRQDRLRPAAANRDSTYGYCEGDRRADLDQRLEARPIGPCRSRLRNATSGAKECIVTIESASARRSKGISLPARTGCIATMRARGGTPLKGNQPPARKGVSRRLRAPLGRRPKETAKQCPTPAETKTKAGNERGLRGEMPKAASCADPAPEAGSGGEFGIGLREALTRFRPVVDGRSLVAGSEGKPRRTAVVRSGVAARR